MTRTTLTRTPASRRSTAPSRPTARGFSSTAAPDRGRAAAPRFTPRPLTGTPAVVRARLRISNGFYENPAVIDAALDRLLDDATARFGRLAQ